MIELADVDLLPVLEVVAGLAIRPEPSFVLVLVASEASRRQPEERPIQILRLDRRTFRRRDVRGVVALVASKPGMLTFQQVPGFFVIERLRVPLDEREILAIVFGVASRALLTRTGWNVIGRVQTAVRGKPSCDFRMTLETLQRSLPAELMATGAIRGSVQRLVRTRKRARRDLGSCRKRQKAN